MIKMSKRSVFQDALLLLRIDGGTLPQPSLFLYFNRELPFLLRVTLVQFCCIDTLPQLSQSSELYEVRQPTVVNIGEPLGPGKKRTAISRHLLLLSLCPLIPATLHGLLAEVGIVS